MGNVLRLYCKQCGYEQRLKQGMGFFSCLRATERAREGEYGEEIRRLMLSDPKIGIDCRRCIYQCPACRHIESAENLSLYRLRAILPGEECTAGDWDKRRIFLHGTDEEQKVDTVRRAVHKCPECGKRMKKLRINTAKNTKAVCPRCHGQAELELYGCFD